MMFSKGMLFVNALDSSVTCLDVIYDSMDNRLKSITVARRIPNAHSLLPLRSCVTHTNEKTYVATASEDGFVHVHDVSAQNGRSSSVKHQCSVKHDAVPIAITSNPENFNMLATADISGTISIWKKVKV